MSRFVTVDKAKSLHSAAAAAGLAHSAAANTWLRYASVPQACRFEDGSMMMAADDRCAQEGLRPYASDGGDW
ncbi:hypothetical protein [Fodinicola feengrottensis]|uniref:hypothetical protein n=1 Tax=Fodinicola feengrottensis TaxID=435914 RepID=UPI0031E34CAF